MTRFEPVENRRRYVGGAVDAILTYWLTGTENEEMREWWTTDEAADCALELVHVVCQSIAESGFTICAPSGPLPHKGAPGNEKRDEGESE